MSRSSLQKKLGISLVSLGVFFPLLELALRVGNYWYPLADEPIAIWNRFEDRELRSGKGLHRSEARQLWSPRPGAEVPWGTDERINAGGYRGPLRPLERTPGVLRIAALGDSSTFGLGVAYADTYSAQLEARLAERGIRAEVLDFGVIGYSIRQGFERYKAVVRAHRPDVVIAAFGAVNDHLPAQGGLPEAEKVAIDPTGQGRWDQLVLDARQGLRTAHLLCRLADVLRGLESQRTLEFEATHRRHTVEQHVGKPRFDKQGGVRRVSLEDFRACFLEFEAAVEADGARLVVVSMPRMWEAEEQGPVLCDYSHLIAELAGGECLPLVDARQAFRDAGPTAEEDLFADFFHPSPNGHSLLAWLLAETIAELLPPPGSAGAR
jgi:lysophospholipase L1-like esterase